MSLPSATAPSSKAVPRGVMDASYAAGRIKKPHLAFRLRSRALMAADALRRYVPDADKPRLLDLGAAEGAALLETHRLLDARESLGIEYAADLIAAAPTLPSNCRLVEGDVTEPHTAVEVESYDLVTAMAVLEHLAEPVELMRQAYRALRPGGLFVASCPSSVWDNISGALGLHQDEYHEGHFDRARFFALGREAGLEPLEYRRFMWAPIGVLPYARIPVSPQVAARLDGVVRSVRVFNWGFVNQLFVARRPQR